MTNQPLADLATAPFTVEAGPDHRPRRLTSKLEIPAHLAPVPGTVACKTVDGEEVTYVTGHGKGMVNPIAAGLARPISAEALERERDEAAAEPAEQPEQPQI